ncbi:MAG TPA: sigma-70 family RNA polymerase sigma factor [Acidobacteriota bacterium]|nr:sigma-70 family RNA polymerase sigma factor [Acidobacteriota bacterium]
MVTRVTETADMRHSEPTALGASESDLIVRARRGESAAWRTLIERYQNQVYAIAFRMVGDADDAQDIAQEVFVRFYRTLDRFRPDGRIATWLYRVAVNLAIDTKRRRLRRPDETVEPVDQNPLPDTRAEQRDLRVILERIIHTLPPKQRRVLVLRDLQGFSTEEIAEILRCRQNTVRVHLARARLRVKEIVTAQYPELTGGMSR